MEYEYDETNLDEFQKRLDEAGITVEEFDLGNYIGLTHRELEWLVNRVLNEKGVK